ncbi:hypothetical protein [Streptomyces sp. KL116D]|uniref:hypothetical protein n=1 Tax=Streptomyces sp. KL116D TaxID=3045152 RepID=UPI00355670D8
MSTAWSAGALVVDTETGKTGRRWAASAVRPAEAARTGGREWDADPDRIRPADDAEQLRAGLIERSLIA